MRKRNTTLIAQKKTPFFKDLRQDLVKNYDLYLMVIPGILFYLFFKYWPMYGLQIAFRDNNPAFGITGSRWVGMKHFIKFVNGFNFTTLMTNTFMISLYSLLVGFPIPIILALLLNSNEHPRFKKTVQMITFR